MSYCDKLKNRVMTTGQWKAEHIPHFANYDVTSGFKKEPSTHPSGKWFWLVCPCGAKHLTDSEAK
jgi:hypothetical protein